MAQTKIVIAEYEPDYLLALERMFVREYQFTAEITLLPNEEALTKYFADPKTIDILLINENLYDQSFVRHNVSHLFILTEEEPDTETTTEYTNNMLYKYMSGRTILDSVISRSGISHATNLHSGMAKVIMLYSPIGGVGQTTVAVGISTLIARNFRRVLYVSTDGLQTFGNILRTPQTLKLGIEKTLQQKGKYTYNVIQPMIAQQLFDVLPPFASSLATLGLTQEHMLFLIDSIKNSGEYDFIIIDSGSDFTEATTNMMAFADQVLLLTKQDELSIYKLHCLLNNIDCSDSHQFAMLCNQYRQDQTNQLLADSGREYPPVEYIEYDPQLSLLNGDYAAGLKSLQKVGQFFL